MLFDDPMVGQSKYGEYYLYAVKNGTDVEYSFFAPVEVNEQIKTLRKGDRFEITKLAEQKGTKIITKFDVKILEKEKTTPEKVNGNSTAADNYYNIMLNSCKDAIKLQNELGGMFDAKSLAVTIFIARTKINGFN